MNFKNLQLPRCALVAYVLVCCLILPTAVAQTAASTAASSPQSAVALASTPLLVRVEQAAPLKMEPSASKSFWEMILPPVISALTALGGALVGGWLGQRSSTATINQKNNEAELKEIRAKLDGFYGPFGRRSHEGALMALELRARQPDKVTFRTLLKLLDPEWLKNASKADQTIVAEIVQNGAGLLALIRDKAGALEPSVSDYLARAAIHFTMLKLAKDGALENDPDRFARYVFPWQLDKVLKLEIARLNARADLLQSKPSETHSPLAALAIPAEFALPEWPKPTRE